MSGIISFGADILFHSNLCVSGKPGPASWPLDSVCPGPDHSGHPLPPASHNKGYGDGHGAIPSQPLSSPGLSQHRWEAWLPSQGPPFHGPIRPDVAGVLFYSKTRLRHLVSKKERDRLPTASSPGVTEARPTLSVLLKLGGSVNGLWGFWHSHLGVWLNFQTGVKNKNKV